MPAHRLFFSQIEFCDNLIDSLVYTVVGDVVTGRLGMEDDVVAHVLLDEAIAIVTADNWVGQVQIADYSAGGL